MGYYGIGIIIGIGIVIVIGIGIVIDIGIINNTFFNNIITLKLYICMYVCMYIIYILIDLFLLVLICLYSLRKKRAHVFHLKEN